jgi:hypothetical protein
LPAIANAGDKAAPVQRKNGSEVNTPATEALIHQNYRQVFAVGLADTRLSHADTQTEQ